jgi:Ca-activated chloride channel family protein
VTALYEIRPKGSTNGPGVDELRYQKSRDQLGGGKDAELLTIKVRYKQPDRNESRLMVQALLDQDRTMAQASEEFRFAAAVDQFGLLLRDSEFKKDASYQSVVRLAESARGPDADGRRTEFVYLAKTAASRSNEQALSARR